MKKNTDSVFLTHHQKQAIRVKLNKRHRKLNKALDAEIQQIYHRVTLLLTSPTSYQNNHLSPTQQQHLHQWVEMMATTYPHLYSRIKFFVDNWEDFQSMWRSLPFHLCKPAIWEGIRRDLTFCLVLMLDFNIAAYEHYLQKALMERVANALQAQLSRTGLIEKLPH